MTLPAPQGIGGFVAGVPTSLPIFACPGCTQGAQGPLFVGPSLSVNIPRDFGLLGVTVSFQGFDLVPSGAPCIGQIHLSDTLDMTVR